MPCPCLHSYLCHDHWWAFLYCRQKPRWPYSLQTSRHPCSLDLFRGGQVLPTSVSPSPAFPHTSPNPPLQILVTCSTSPSHSVLAWPLCAHCGEGRYVNVEQSLTDKRMVWLTLGGKLRPREPRKLAQRTQSNLGVGEGTPDPCPMLLPAEPPHR